MDRTSTRDDVFEWKEPSTIRRALFSSEIRLWLITLPILFPIFGGFGFFMFAVKVWKNGRSLKEVPVSGILLVSLLLAAIFSLFGLLKTVLQRFSPITILLKIDSIEKRQDGWGKQFSCRYEEIKSATLTKHNLAPKVSAISLKLKAGEMTYLGVSDDIIGKILEILKKRGVHCEQPDETGRPDGKQTRTIV